MLLFWGKIEDWMFTWQRDWNDGCISAGRGVVSVWEEDPLEGDVDGLICNPLTCALFLTCTHNHCSAEQSMAQKHAALLPAQPTLLCSNQCPRPHTLEPTVHFSASLDVSVLLYLCYSGALECIFTLTFFCPATKICTLRPQWCLLVHFESSFWPLQLCESLLIDCFLTYLQS